MKCGIEVEWLEVEDVDIWAGKAAPCTLQRKAMPYHAPLSRTWLWVERLPDCVKPNALVRQFPRVANQIAASWREPVVLNLYFESLLLDDRGHRKGFPTEVHRELVALSAFYAWCQNAERWSALTL